MSQTPGVHSRRGSDEQVVAGVRLRGAGGRVRRRDRLVIALVVLLAAAVAVATAAVVFAVRKDDEAARARRLGTSRELAATALATLDRSPERALLLAFEAYRRVAGSSAGDAYDAHNALLVAFERNARLKDVLHGYSGQARAIEFSPDGRTLAVSSSDDSMHSVIRLWDARRRAPIGRPIRTDLTSELRFSPDGRTLLSSSEYGLLHAFDPVRGVERHKPFKILPFVDHFEDDPGGSELSTDGRVVVTAGPHGALTAWDVDGGRPLVSVNVGDPLGVTWSVSPDGRFLAVSLRGAVMLWDLIRRAPIRAPKDAAASLAFGADSRTLALGTGRGVVLWDVARKRAARPPLRTRIGAAGPVAMSGDGRWLASTGSGGRVDIWNLARTVPVPRRLEGRGEVTWLEFSPDSGTLMLARAGETMFVDVATRKELAGPISVPLPQAADGYTIFAFSSDGKAVASAADDGAVRLWDLSHSVPLERTVFQRPDPAACCEGADSLSFSPDGRTLATGGVAGGIGLWDTTRGVQIGELGGSSDEDEELRSIAFSPGRGRTLAGLPMYAGVELWDVAHRTQVATLPRGGVGHQKGGTFFIDISLNDIAFSPDGGTLAAADDNGTVRFWKLSNGEPVGRIVGAGDKIAYSPDGKLLVSGSLLSKRVALFDVASRAQIGRPLSSGEGLTSVAFSPDGRAFASAGTDGTVRIWTLSRGAALPGVPLSGHTGEVDGVAFSPDGRTLVSAGDDGTLRLWDVVRRAPLGGPLAAPDGVVDGLAVSSRGTLASSHYDGTIRSWDDLLLSSDPDAWRARICAIVGRNLTVAEWRTFVPGEPYRATCPR